jgi:hypothetical protein
VVVAESDGGSDSNGDGQKRQKHTNSIVMSIDSTQFYKPYRI